MAAYDDRLRWRDPDERLDIDDGLGGFYEDWDGRSVDSSLTSGARGADTRPLTEGLLRGLMYGLPLSILIWLAIFVVIFLGFRI